MDSCGPSNALQSLSKHSQVDRTLQQESSNRIQHPQNNSNSSFRSNNLQNVDANLNNEFSQFNSFQNTPQFNNHFSNNFAQNNQRLQYTPQLNNSFNNQNETKIINENNWANDFSRLSLNQGQQNQPVLSNDWNQQFAQQRAGIQQHIQQQQPFHNAPTNSFATNFLNMRTNLSSPLVMTSTPQVTEHREVHNFEQEQELFSKEFSQLENELMEHQPTHGKKHLVNQQQPYDPNKEQFANAARQVVDAMNSKSNPSRTEETNSKFANSSFLKLMSQISNREVELNDQGTKLVNISNGEDIRSYLPDPLKDLRNEHHSLDHPYEYTGSHTQSHNERDFNESIQQENELGDPLAGIKNGELSSNPFEAARMTNPNINANDWEETV